MFLMGQGGLDQGAAAGGGLHLNLPLLLGSAWSVLLEDVVQDIEYQTRPYQTKPGVKRCAPRRTPSRYCIGP